MRIVGLRNLGIGAHAPYRAVGLDNLISGELNMKKLVLALAAMAAFTGSASAADMAVKARPAPLPPPPVANWTGCYIAGSVGYGLFDNEGDAGRFRDPITGVVSVISAPIDHGGRGWLAGGGGGCDYQFGFGGGGGFFRQARPQRRRSIPHGPSE